MSQSHTTPATVPLTAKRPLLIVDADEVLLRFAEGFERFLDAHGMFIDFSSYRLLGNVRWRDSDERPLDIEVTALIEEFRADLDDLDAVEHASESLARLCSRLQIVVLSNVNASQAPARLRNFHRLGWSWPLLCNSGPKGSAIAALAQRAGQPVFFVDDMPQHLDSAAAHAAEVLRIHLIGDRRLRQLVAPAQRAHLCAEDWREATAFIEAQLPP